MTKTYRLITIQDAVAVATNLSRSWFRGHSRAVNQLTPRVYRPDFTDEVMHHFRPQLELQTIEAFKRDAGTLSHEAIPPQTDHLGWLQLMQHYRAPTRLLDWTENALIALYFAVCDRNDRAHDGELWAMYHQALNREAGVGPGLPLIDTNPVLRYLLEEPYWGGTPASLAEKIGLEAPILRPVALQPRRVFRRMTAQASTFTVHPRPDTGHTIPEVLFKPTELVRYLIPKEHKRRLLQDLYSLGISHVLLFPDLEGLANKVLADARVVAYTSPEPPEASGLVAE